MDQRVVLRCAVAIGDRHGCGIATTARQRCDLRGRQRRRIDPCIVEQPGEPARVIALGAESHGQVVGLDGSGAGQVRPFLHTVDVQLDGRAVIGRRDMDPRSVGRVGLRRVDPEAVA